ncbi:ABC transporter permease subunit [Spirillospora albida]|uniref:ABC transporter permease subunit n=1 Tax=Spirillospora albida TaxID=58123 RepID=UPI0004C00B25|nr:ABC transporter permease subunit [Spirillospora albida]
MTLLEPARPPLPLLVVVELRKMTDTRSGRWLLALVGLSTLVLLPVVLYTVPKQDQTMTELFISSQVGTLLLPLLGILSVTAEWSQRTAISTFALVPQRGRVLAAKLLAGAALGALYAVIGLASGYAARAAGALLGRSGGAWTLPPSLVATTVLHAVLVVMIGVAFGALLMNPALAIVLYFLLPTVWTIAGQSIRRLKEPAAWLDTNLTLKALLEHNVTTAEWSRVGTSLVLWLALPLAVGAVRLARREVS